MRCLTKPFTFHQRLLFVGQRLYSKGMISHLHTIYDESPAVTIREATNVFFHFPVSLLYAVCHPSKIIAFMLTLCTTSALFQSCVKASFLTMIHILFQLASGLDMICIICGVQLVVQSGF
jgi:hypothetical protein